MTRVVGPFRSDSRGQNLGRESNARSQAPQACDEKEPLLRSRSADEGGAGPGVAGPFVIASWGSNDAAGIEPLAIGCRSRMFMLAGRCRRMFGLRILSRDSSGGRRC